MGTSDSKKSRLGVHSEIGRLRRVIVHSPGPELLAVTPSTRREYLYDDVIDLEGAREEHRRFVSILRRFSEVLELRDLLTETLALPEAREFLIARSEQVTSDGTFRTDLERLDPGEMVQRYIEGWRNPPGPFAQKLEKQSYVVPPLPNLFFTRDASMIIGRHAIISAMRFTSRWPEEALMRTIVGYHPEMDSLEILYDGSNERRHGYIVEGGDVHPLRRDLVLAGVSERTSAAAIDQLCEVWFDQTDIRDVLVVVLPEHSTAIHLDMVWTQIDRELCVAYPPLFRGPTRAPVLHRRKGRAAAEEPADLFAAFRSVGLPMQPIWAGGAQWETQEREQWASGCNLFAVAPGQAISYARTEETLRAIESSGFKIISGEDLLLGDQEIASEERGVITFVGAELVRGGGGPRCMTCPIQRDEL